MIDAIAESDRIRSNFFCPGHKHGTVLHERLRKLLGEGDHTILSSELPELLALDNLFAADGVIEKYQELASGTFTRGKTDC